MERGERTEKRGQWLAFLLFLFIIGGGIYLLTIGKELAGYVSLVGGIAFPIILFVASRRYSERNLMKKWSETQGG